MDKEKKEEKKKPTKTLKEKRLEKKEKKGKFWFLCYVAFYYLHRGEPLPGFFFYIGIVRAKVFLYFFFWNFHSRITLFHLSGLYSTD